MQVKMKMERREVNSNMVVTNGKRGNMVNVKLSDLNFKTFLQLCNVYGVAVCLTKNLS